MFLSQCPAVQTYGSESSESKMRSVSGPSFPDRDVKLTADALYIAKLGSNRFIGASFLLYQF